MRDSKNGNTIFLPEAGQLYPGDDDLESGGYYWSSTFQIMKFAYCLEFDAGRKRVTARDYFTGMSIRLVFDEKN